jgi:hypothetical protein
MKKWNSGCDFLQVHARVSQRKNKFLKLTLCGTPRDTPTRQLATKKAKPSKTKPSKTLQQMDPKQDNTRQNEEDKAVPPTSNSSHGDCTIL